ncbi:MAG TPA: LysM peptidoglycan-binding domain-containing protein [Saprospiraceae bacterium]|nr:LysM peptidoglycan-binding domain-containing protein [Saprospiraceae bacterium]
MKHLLFLIFAFCATTATFAQPAPAYVLFNKSCMQQLEYKYTRTGVTLYAYSVQPNADEQYLFLSGSSSMPTAELPVGTFDCGNLRLNDEVVKIINEQADTRQLYILHQQSTGGYLMMPIYAAMQIKRYGPWYLLVGPKYTFAVDTTKLSYQDNLQGETSPTIVRFAGSQLANCRYQWRFHGEPTRGGTDKMDFEFIYGIGLVSNRVGATATDLEQSEVRLSSIDGVPFERYLAAICHTEVVNTTIPSKVTTPANEPDKEGYYTGNQNTGNQTPATVNPYNCPTPPGKGYHVVQKGESLKAIARTYKVDLKTLLNWNNIKDPDHIEICQQIWVQKPPTGAKTVAPATQAKPQHTTDGPTVQDQSIYWNNGNKNTVAPAQYNKKHVVQKGESLYSIAKKYVCAEECIRRANNFPLSGNVPLQIGQTLAIPDCSCQSSGYVEPPRTPTNTAVSNPLNNQANNPPPVQQDAPPEYGNYTNPAATNPAATSPANPANPAQNTQAQPPTQEYIVRQGETMNSIAVKFKMNVAELSALNNIATDEKLTAGRRLVVRKY